MIAFYKIFKTVRAFSLVDRCVQMRVCKHGCGVTLYVFPWHNLKPFQSRQSNSQVQILKNSNDTEMKKTFSSFDLGIDHLFSSDPWKESKRKKNNSVLRVSILAQLVEDLDEELDDLVEGAQGSSEDNKILCNKIHSKRFSR